MESLSVERMISGLSALGENMPKIFCYRETDSTNTRAKEYARAHPESRECALFVADSQTAGRGRLGRSFHSADGAGLYMSLLVYPSLRGADATSVTASCAVALARAIERVSGLSSDIKWVNDLYAKGRKLAGILAECEMASDGEIAFLVLGMGINVYKIDYPSDISDIAISLEEAAEKKISREELCSAAVREVLEQIEHIGSDEIYDEYKKRSLIIGREVTVHGTGEPYTALAEDIERDFSLTVRRDGVRERLFTGEVSVRMNNLKRG